MNNVVIGQYVPGHSFLYKMDPRSKIIALILFMISTFILNNVFHILALLVGVLLIVRFGGVPVGRILKGLKPIMVLLTFTFVFQILFVNTGSLLYQFELIYTKENIILASLIFVIYYITKRWINGGLLYFLFTIGIIITIFHLYPVGTKIGGSLIQIYDDGVKGAFFIMIRLVIIVTLSTLLTMTTKPTDLTLGLERLMKPMQIIHINSEEIAMIISIALRYIPTLLDEANKIMLAQASRGVDFNEGKFKDKIMQIISLLVPMFIISFKRSEELADAMEARNFVPGQKRTRLHVLTWKLIDSIVVFSGAITIFISIWVVTLS
jgi:energy-coupling factor transport system permease protein